MKYAQKSSAVRAARKQGLLDDQIVTSQNDDGTWSFSDAREQDLRPRFLKQKGEKASLSSSISDQIAAAQSEPVETSPAVVVEEIPAKKSRKRLAAIETAIAEAPVREPKAPKAPKAPVERKTTDRPDGLRVGSKAALLVDLVTRPEGATYQELLDATGWGECRPRLKEACVKAGLALELRKAETKGEPSRYFATK